MAEIISVQTLIDEKKKELVQLKKTLSILELENKSLKKKVKGLESIIIKTNLRRGKKDE